MRWKSALIIKSRLCFSDRIASLCYPEWIVSTDQTLCSDKKLCCYFELHVVKCEEWDEDLRRPWNKFCRQSSNNLLNAAVSSINVRRGRYWLFLVFVSVLNCPMEFDIDVSDVWDGEAVVIPSEIPTHPCSFELDGTLIYSTALIPHWCWLTALLAACFQNLTFHQGTRVMKPNKFLFDKCMPWQSFILK